MNNITPGQVADIPITSILPDPDQPRKAFDQDALERLGTSLKGGVQVPLLVRRDGEKFRIHDGERRFRAAVLAKLETLPVLVLDDGAGVEDIRVAQLAVNQMREQLKPMEIARTLADLQRNHFKSINELQAHLEAHGMPAMKPKQIRDLVVLVDLPEWVQDLIDAGTIEPSAARKAKKAERYPEVMKELEDECRRDAGFGRLSSDMMSRNVNHAFQTVGINLGRTQYYYDDPVCFDLEKICKGCEHLVQVNTMSYCMNREGFERHQAEAKEAGLGPGGKKLPKSETTAAGGAAPADDKAEKRAEQLERKAEEYLHGYLVGLIEQAMLDDVQLGDRKLSQIDINDELLAWHGMDEPGRGGATRCYNVPGYSARDEARVRGLESLFDEPYIEQVKTLAAIQVLRDIPLREALVIAHQLWGTEIELVWRLDAGYLALLRKAELVDFAEAADLPAPEGKTWKSMKLAELRTELLEFADNCQVPALLAEIYENVAEPSVPYGWDDE